MSESKEKNTLRKEKNMGFFDKLSDSKKNEKPNGIEKKEDDNSETNEEVSEKVRQYSETFTEDDTPGWSAIDEELLRVYTDQSERHYGTVIKYIMGGKDPIDGFSIYDNTNQLFHRHIISYGMSELYYDPESADNEFSKWGFEFTMRVIPFSGDIDTEKPDGTKVECEPYWAMNLMQNLARYVFDSGKYFEQYHFIPVNSPIRVQTDTKLVGIAFAPDVQLSSIDTPNGKVDFLQMVGLTQKELDWLLEDPKTSRVKELVDKMRIDNPMLIVDLNREKEYVD